MIRDTSQQDAIVAPPTGHKIKRRALLIGGAVALVAVSASLYAAWSGSEHSVSSSRVRIAEVSRSLVRQIGGTIVNQAPDAGEGVGEGEGFGAILVVEASAT